MISIEKYTVERLIHPRLKAWCSVFDRIKFAGLCLFYFFMILGGTMFLPFIVLNFDSSTSGFFAKVIPVAAGVLIGIFHPNIFISISAFIIAMFSEMIFIQFEKDMISALSPSLIMSLYASVFLYCGLNSRAFRYFSFIVAASVFFIQYCILLFFMDQLQNSSFSFKANSIYFSVILIGALPFIIRNAVSVRRAAGAAALVLMYFAVYVFMPEGIFYALLIFTLSLYLQSKTLYFIGLILFGSSLFVFYYHLDTTLIMKSAILGASGILCIASGFAAKYAYSFINSGEIYD